jgi:hypothetical protein
MSECSQTGCHEQTRTGQRACPVNGKLGAVVPRKTILYHLAQPWRRELTGQNYYFCADPACEVVYFDDDDSLIHKSELRTRVGLKELSNDALVCYCFGVTRQVAETEPQAKAFVVEQTRQSRCACATYNPSARCCLKDFPKR